MTGTLQTHDDEGASGGGADARCAFCGALAVGPCASCAKPVCGDCCVLTEGGAKPYAICLACDKTGGRSLRSGWRLVLFWSAIPLLALLVAVLLLSWLLGASR